MAKSLAVMVSEVYENNVSKGWFESDRTFGDDIALLHSEVSEMLENFRAIGLQPRTVTAPHYTGCQLHEYKDGICTCGVVGKPDDVAAETADVFIRLLDFAMRYGIDLEAEYERKMTYNRTRPFKHGNKAL